MTPFLRIAIGLANALGAVHTGGLVHKDIKPTNIFVNRETGHVWLTGFGISSRLARERQTPDPPELIAGTLAYMAPEQTGRMNRSIDSRSDLYALGVTLYQTLTGSLPFQASTPLEWVHCHIARPPVSPAERAPNVPAAVAAIVMKLLAKTAEDRYQTAAGLEHDLHRCLVEWEAGRRIADFPLGESDKPDRLLIPEKLYGRTRDIETLLASFDRVVTTGTPELVLVSGYSGIGKSSIVNELHKLVVPVRGLFASGKCDQYKRDIPYATIAQAFQSLLHPLLTKREAELNQWRDALLEAVGPNGRIIVELLPELTLIIGEQPPVPELPAQDAQHRFQLVFRRFISVFARPEHPLALFLDDLQWLDEATLDLLEDLLTRGDVSHLLLIGAYRENEVDPSHPLPRKLAAIRQTGAAVDEIGLAPLAYQDVEQFIADSLHCERGQVASLARLIYDKTGGNPFFSIQFLSALADEGLLVFVHDQRQWSWDVNRILAKGYTDNVVELLVGQLTRLPAETQTALQHLACLGGSVDFTLLRMIFRDSVDDMHGQLWEAARAGLIVRGESWYCFVHDRVHEAAYSLIQEPSRAEAHLRIGRVLAEDTPEHEREQTIFEIVNQLNRATHLITSDDERQRVAEFNLVAARRAKLSTAYVSALTYLAVARALLTDESWDTHHELIFSIECLTAECELPTARTVAAENRLSMLAARANSDHHSALVTRLRLTLYTTLDRSDRAVEVCLEYLRRSGTEWSRRPSADEVRTEYDRIWTLLGTRPIEEVVDQPLMTNADLLDDLDVLTEFVTPALFSDENLSSLVICRMVNLSLGHGVSDASCFAFVWFAIIAGPRFGNYKDGFRFGQLGYDLVEKRGLRRFKARTYMSFGDIVLPWTRHVRAGRDLVRCAFDAAKEIGDLTFAGYCCDHLIKNMLAVGDPLVDTQREADISLQFAQTVRFGLVIDHIRAQLGLIRTLRGLTPTFGSFNDDQFDELQFERHLGSNTALAELECWYWVRKLQARFFAGDYATALDAAARARQQLWTSPSQFETAELTFYSALSLAASWDSWLPEKHRQHLDALTADHRELEVWAEHCPANFENRAALVGAEIARIEGRDVDAMRLYEAAIRSARANGFVHNESVAHEAAARFCAARGFDQFASMYLKEARYGYLRWGANGKVKQLERAHAQLAEEPLPQGPTSTIVASLEVLDLATVISVTQAVSGEMVLEKVIDRVMCAAIEHAGAERGLLILPRADQPQVEAEATINENHVVVHVGDVPPTAFPESLVRYVMRTHEAVIVDDALGPNPFSADPYVIQRRARSMLCLPFINQGQLTAVIYLENNLAPQVFTPSRIAVLKVLASQAASALENARLYRDLEHREAEIRALKDQLYHENLALRDEIDRASMFEEIVGSSAALKVVLSRIAKVAPTDSTVLITGETGTGKELIARAVHRRSNRSGRPFVSVNCAALAPALISSELFGHEKGAFTGAMQRRVGRFEQADGGTIFLDEVGELPPETQVALLRVLQEREFERVGGTQPIRVDVRLIAATNRDLKTAVAGGAFRQDLFYRLNVFPIEAPPLRERNDDVLMLVEYFLHRYATRAGKTFRSIDKRTLDLLQRYDWPGNIRELQNIIERSVILSVGDVFSVDQLWLSRESSRPVTRAKSSIEDDPRDEREMIEAALSQESRPGCRAIRCGGQAAHSRLDARIQNQGAQD